MTEFIELLEAPPIGRPPMKSLEDIQGCFSLLELNSLLQQLDEWDGFPDVGQTCRVDELRARVEQAIDLIRDEFFEDDCSGPLPLVRFGPGSPLELFHPPPALILGFFQLIKQWVTRSSALQ